MKAFVNAVDNLMKKGNKRTSDNSDIRVIDASNIPNGIERLVEVVKHNEKGNVVVKFYGPNKKRGCTVMVTKTKDHAVQFASDHRRKK